MCRSRRWAVLAVAALVWACDPRPAVADDAVFSGTAFVVSKNGCMITCAHVVEGAARIRVLLAGREYEASLLRSDEKHDLALVRVEATGLPALPLGNSNAVEVGEDVRVFGYPLSTELGVSVKVTRGIISGIQASGVARVFQTDAPINPGNSGGPLLNAHGAVIGVVNAKLTGANVSNVGFAMPVNYAKALIELEGVVNDAKAAETSPDGTELVRRVSPSVAFLLVSRRADRPPKDGVVQSGKVAALDFDRVDAEYKKKAEAEARFKAIQNRYNARIDRRDRMWLLTEEEQTLLDSLYEKEPRTDDDRKTIEDLETKDRRVRAELETLSQKRDSDLSEADKKKLQDAAARRRDATQELKAFKDRLANDLECKGNLERERLTGDVREAAARIAALKGFEKAVGKGDAPSGAEDITEAVIAELNKR